MPIKLAIAEDNSFLLKAILDKRSLFSDIIVKFHAVHGQDFVEKLNKDPKVHLVLRKIEMLKMNGIGAVEIISQKYPKINRIC